MNLSGDMINQRVGDNRKYLLPSKHRTTVNIDKRLRPFIKAYAAAKQLYYEEATTELMAIGLAKVYNWEARALPKPSTISRAMHKLWGNKGVEAGIALGKPVKTLLSMLNPDQGTRFQSLVARVYRSQNRAAVS